jgi:hypothetical protein
LPGDGDGGVDTQSAGEDRGRVRVRPARGRPPVSARAWTTTASNPAIPTRTQSVRGRRRPLCRPHERRRSAFVLTDPYPATRSLGTGQGRERQTGMHRIHPGEMDRHAPALGHRGNGGLIHPASWTSAIGSPVAASAAALLDPGRHPRPHSAGALAPSTSARSRRGPSRSATAALRGLVSSQSISTLSMPCRRAGHGATRGGSGSRSRPPQDRAAHGLRPSRQSLRPAGRRRRSRS